MADEKFDARAEIRRIIGDNPGRVYLRSGYSGTTLKLSYLYQGKPWLVGHGQPWPISKRYAATAIDIDRLEYVLWLQATFKRRFWSWKLLIRLLELLVMVVYCHRDEGRRLDADYKAAAMGRGGLFEELFAIQTTPSIQFMVPTLRPVPKVTLFLKLEWVLDKLISSDPKHFIDRDSRDPNEFIQYWMKFVRTQSNLPSAWFSWHNDEFPEYFEWTQEVADDDNLGDFSVDIVW